MAGDSDILVTPDIEAGNVLYKSIAYFVRAKMAAIIVGAKAPVILTSRADTHEAKFLSIALATATA
ncbi:MAG: Phosphate acetyltransferase [bacterium ADurb.Bin243]|nr:MAG: Phosphate acetyltransferase [bacterium ADurb.Bin243]